MPSDKPLTKSGDHKGRGHHLHNHGTRAPQPDSPHNNRKSSAIRHSTNGDGFSAHHGAAGGPVDHHQDLQEHVKSANSEARARYNATHRYPISGGM